METHIRRFLLSLVGLGVGSFLASVTFLIVSTLLMGENPLDALEIWAAPGTLYVLLFSLPCGLIGHALLYALKLRGLLAYVVIAEIALAASIALFFGLLGQPSTDELKTRAAAAVATAVCAATAWLIRRPDKDGQPTEVAA